MIFTGLLMVGLRSPEETSFVGILIFYYLLFGGIAFSITATGKRTAIQGIGLNLFFFMTPFIPLILMGYLYSIQQVGSELSLSMAGWIYRRPTTADGRSRWGRTGVVADPVPLQETIP